MSRRTAQMDERRPLASDVVVSQPGAVRLNIPDEEDGSHLAPPSGIKKSLSMTSIRAKIRDKREKFRQNQCAGILLFLIFGTVCNVLAYFASVWSAQLNAELVKSAVENEHTFRFKLKKSSALAEGPSKYLIGLLNFGGRVLSAIGTVMLVQVVAAYCKRRRYSVLMKSAAEEADVVISDAHGGITDTAGECCLTCFQSLT